MLGCEVEVADQVDIAPGDGRGALEHFDGFQVSGCHFLLVDPGEEQGVVVDDGVGDEAGTLVPYLLFGQITAMFSENVDFLAAWCQPYFSGRKAWSRNIRSRSE